VEKFSAHQLELWALRIFVEVKNVERQNVKQQNVK
jgi:hypothetical protein